MAVAVSGCGSGGGPAAALDPVAQAAETTTHAGGAQVEATVRMDLAGLGSPLTLSAHGAVNFKSHEGEIFTELSGLPAAAQALVPAGGATITELFKGDSVYVGSSLFAGKLPGGASWMKVDLGHLTQQLGFDPQALSEGQSNPAQYLEYLRAAGGSVHAAGGAVVRGVRTTRYVGTIDLRKAAEMLPTGNRAAAEQAIEKLIGQIGTSSVPIEAWVDGHDMIRRLNLAMTLVADGQQASVEVQEELFDFGPTPSVNPPAGGEVYEPDLAALSGNGGG
ncbi:MAG: hypothetical protein ACLQBB_04735 [Solirubrobacteraceae bacterium]